jgi:hypothetical protein
LVSYLNIWAWYMTLCTFRNMYFVHFMNMGSHIWPFTISEYLAPHWCHSWISSPSDVWLFL